jgi:hypothetical protein
MTTAFGNGVRAVREAGLRWTSPANCTSSSTTRSGSQRWVMACVKHYALNSVEKARFAVDVTVDGWCSTGRRPRAQS